MAIEVDVGGILVHNDSYDYDDDYEYKDDSDPGKRDVLIPLLYSAVLVAGLLGNGLLLVVLFLKRRSWSIPDTFVLHQCIADVLLLLTLPVWAAQRCWWCFEFGLIPCKISTALFYVNFYCGIFLLVCIVLDRCLSVCRGTRVYTKSRPSLAHITCLCVWICSLILATPTWIFVATSKAPGDEVPTCAGEHPAGSAARQLVPRLLHHTLGFLLPAATLIVCCSCVALRLHGSSKESQKQRAFTVVLCLVGVFLLCWVPFNTALIVNTVRSRSEQSGDSLKTALLVTSVFGYVHTCLRPLAYLSLSGSLRTQALALLRCAPAEPADSLWELGVGEDGQTERSHKVEEQQEMTGGDHHTQSSQC